MGKLTANLRARTLSCNMTNIDVRARRAQEVLGTSCFTRGKGFPEGIPPTSRVTWKAARQGRASGPSGMAAGCARLRAKVGGQGEWNIPDPEGVGNGNSILPALRDLPSMLVKRRNFLEIASSTPVFGPENTPEGCSHYSGPLRPPTPGPKRRNFLGNCVVQEPICTSELPLLAAVLRLLQHGRAPRPWRGALRRSGRKLQDPQKGGPGAPSQGTLSRAHFWPSGPEMLTGTGVRQIPHLGIPQISS